MRTTVLIPLHASARWLPVVAGNIERLAPYARLVVSDATGVDDTLDRLRQRFGDLAEIDWVGPRPLARGWVPHCNDLVARASTEFVMWMPHDDEADADWVTLGESALDADPGAVLALGQLRSLELDGQGGYDRALPSRIILDPHPPFLGRDVADRASEAVAVCLHGNQSWLGVAFRGVFRRESAVPLPDTGVDGAWADILWAISMLTVGSFTATDAVYWKRWYDGNTHGTWADPRNESSFRAESLPQALARLSPGVREHVLARSWSNDALTIADNRARLAAQRGELQAQLHAQGRELRRARATVTKLRRKLRSAQTATVALRREFEASTSWRLTAPFRAAVRVTRRSADPRHPG